MASCAAQSGGRPTSVDPCRLPTVLTRPSQAASEMETEEATEAPGSELGDACGGPPGAAFIMELEVLLTTDEPRAMMEPRVRGPPPSSSKRSSSSTMPVSTQKSPMAPIIAWRIIRTMTLRVNRANRVKWIFDVHRDGNAAGPHSGRFDPRGASTVRTARVRRR